MLPLLRRNQAQAVLTKVPPSMVALSSLFMSNRFVTIAADDWSGRRANDFASSEDAQRRAIDIPAPSRTSFRNDFCVNFIAMGEKHPHPRSKLARDQASYGIDSFIKSHGYKVYSLSKDSRHHSDDGERFYYSTRDLSLDVSCDPITCDHIISMIDVDYYYDMVAVMLLARPILLYTYVPNHVGFADSEGVYTVADDVVSHVINGGGNYKHKIWDYAHDYLTVYEVLPNGLAHMVLYAVEQLEVRGSNGHRIVYLCPQRDFIGSSLVLAKLPQTPLVRRVITRNGINYLSHFVDGELHYSFSVCGATTSATMSHRCFMTLWNRWQASGKLNFADTERVLKHVDPTNDTDIACYAVRLLTSPNFDVTMLGMAPIGSCGLISPISPSAKHYVVGDSNTDSFKTYANAYSRCILSTESVFPAECYDNDLACIEGRIINVKNSVVPPNKYIGYASEFLDRLVVVTGMGVPHDVQDVIDMQDLPNQRLRNQQEFWMLAMMPEFIVRSFQKREAYPAINDPRNISRCPTDHILNLSAFTYAFKENVLKNVAWFMPCRDPLQVATAVHELARANSYLCMGDYSRFDGTISHWLRVHVEFSAYRRWVCRVYLTLLNTYLEQELSPKAITSQGLWYMAESSRLSGSPLTTDGNSIINAFVSYCVGRNMGRPPDLAWRYIGLIYGDDSLAVADPRVAEATAADLGLKLKVERVEPGGLVNFLGRVYVDAWTTTSSIQDPKRTLSKLHVTCAPLALVPLEVAAVAKATGYLVIDSITPVISDYCHLIVAIYGEAAARWQLDTNNIDIRSALRKDVPYFALEHRHSWPQSEDDFDLYFFAMARCLDITVSDVHAYVSQLNHIIFEPCAPADKLKMFNDLLPIDSHKRTVKNTKPRVVVQVQDDDGNWCRIAPDLPDVVHDIDDLIDIASPYEVLMAFDQWCGDRPPDEGQPIYVASGVWWTKHFSLSRPRLNPDVLRALLDDTLRVVPPVSPRGKEEAE